MEKKTVKIPDAQNRYISPVVRVKGMRAYSCICTSPTPSSNEEFTEEDYSNQW